MDRAPISVARGNSRKSGFRIRFWPSNPRPLIRMLISSLMTIEWALRIYLEKKGTRGIKNETCYILAIWLCIESKYSMETCLCRQTLRIKDLYKMCLHFYDKWFKSKLKPRRKIAQKDFLIE